jgi:type I restriction enzyme, S subunit
MSARLPLKRVAQVDAGQSPSSSEVDELSHGLPFLQGNAEFGNQFPAPRYECSSPRKRARPGDILLSVRAPVGAINIADRPYGIGRGLVSIHVETANGCFVWWWLHSQQSALNAVSTGTTYPAVTAEDVGHLPFPQLSIDEQRRIADFLDAETARIDSLTSTYAYARNVLLERRMTRIFNAVTGYGITDRVPSRLAWVESLPRTWQSVKLGHFARMGSGHTPSRSRPDWWENCTIPWITTGEVSQVRDDRLEVLTKTRERISDIGMANSSAELHPKGTVVLCRTASAGYSAIMGEDMATSQDFVTWTCGPNLDPFYLLWCLRAMRSDLLGRLAMGSTHKTIYVPDLQAVRVPLPPLAEQQRIVTLIRSSNSANDAAIDAIDRQLALLAEKRQAVITAAVTGQIDTTARGIASAEGAA